MRLENKREVESTRKKLAWLEREYESVLTLLEFSSNGALNDVRFGKYFVLMPMAEFSSVFS